MRRAPLVAIAVATAGCYLEVQGRPRPARARWERDSAAAARESAVREEVRLQLEGAERYAREHSVPVTPSPEPPPPPPETRPSRTASDAVWLSAGQRNTCIVVVGGKVRCWAPFHGESSGLEGVSRVAVGYTQACALDGERKVWCWEDGSGKLDERKRPIAVGDVVALASGWHTTCAVLGDGTVSCWGSNLKGELGDGTTTGRRGAPLVPGVTDAVDVTGGEHFFCALRKNATVVCWGDGTLGQLGQGDSRKELQRPVAPKGLVAVVAIAAGRQHACAARDDGRVLCWGLGGGGPGNDSPTLVRGLDRVVELAAGEDTTCARRESGEVWCWGSAPVPAPARGDPVTRLRLGRALPGIDDAVQIAVGADNVCARRATGKIACFSR